MWMQLAEILSNTETLFSISQRTPIGATQEHSMLIARRNEILKES